MFDGILMVGGNNFVGYLPLEVERLEKLQILDVRKCLEFYEINLCVTMEIYLVIVKSAKLMKVRLKNYPFDYFYTR